MALFFLFKVKQFTNFSIVLILLFFAGCAYMEFEGLEEFAQKGVLSFSFSSNANASLYSTISGAISSNTITLTVPYNTDITNLVPEISFVGASISPSPGSARDFTNPVTYTVTAGNGTTASYKVEVIVDNTSKDILSFNFLYADNSDDLNSNYYGAVNSVDQTISFTVPFETIITSLSPAIVINGASVSPSANSVNNFSGSVDYIVTAGDGTTKTYTVNVTVAPNTAKEITDFRFTTGKNPGVIFSDLSGDIDEQNLTIALTVPPNTPVGSLVPSITITGNSIDPANNDARDFTDSVDYIVTAANGSTKTYSVTVTVAPNTAKDILYFDFYNGKNSGLAVDVSGDVDSAARTVALTVPYNTDLTSLVPTLTISGDSVSPSSDATVDFTDPVEFTVSAEDGSEKVYLATVTAAGNADTRISSFGFFDALNDDLSVDVTADVNNTDHTIDLVVPAGTVVSALVPTIVLPDQAEISPAGGDPQNFTDSVTYQVTAGDGSVQDYIVSVIIDEAPSIDDKTINYSNITDNSVYLSWTNAEDNMTPASQLQYTLIYDTVDITDTGHTGHTTGMGWSYNALNTTINGLTTGNWYYFNVFVKDEQENVSLYKSIHLKISADDPGTSNFYFRDNLIDNSNNGYDLTADGTVTFVNDRDGNSSSAIQLTGGSFLYYDDPTAFNFTESMTISVWVNIVDTTVDQKIVGKVTRTANGDPADLGYVLGVRDRRLHIETWNSNSDEVGFYELDHLGNELQSGVWVHLALTWKRNGTIKAFVNGEQVGATKIIGDVPLGVSNTRNLVIGAAPWDTSLYRVNGIIDDLRLMGLELSPAEIMDLYNQSAN